MEAFLQSNEISTLIKLLLALLCGGILGFERGIKKRPAGFRTYILVCVASTMVMITNQYIAGQYSGIDPTRMASQVISGIGFLGAGTIIVTGKSQVKGLTTAAGLWASACIGLTIGVGYYTGAIMGTSLIFIVMSLLHDVDNYITSLRSEFTIYIEFESITNIASFLQYIKYHSIRMIDMELIKSNKNNEDVVGALFTIRLNKKVPYIDVMQLINKSEGVRSVEEV